MARATHRLFVPWVPSNRRRHLAVYPAKGTVENPTLSPSLSARRPTCAAIPHAHGIARPATLPAFGVASSRLEACIALAPTRHVVSAGQGLKTEGAHTTATSPRAPTTGAFRRLSATDTAPSPHRRLLRAYVDLAWSLPDQPAKVERRLVGRGSTGK
jgi:hypothetical protein